MAMSEAEGDMILGRTLREYQTAKRKRAILCAEAEFLAAQIVRVADAMEYGGDPDLKDWPPAEKLQVLFADIKAAKEEEFRLFSILEDAGYLSKS